MESCFLSYATIVKNRGEKMLFSAIDVPAGCMERLVVVSVLHMMALTSPHPRLLLQLNPPVYISMAGVPSEPQ